MAHPPIQIQAIVSESVPIRVTFVTQCPRCRNPVILSRDPHNKYKFDLECHNCGLSSENHTSEDMINGVDQSIEDYKRKNNLE